MRQSGAGGEFQQCAIRLATMVLAAAMHPRKGSAVPPSVDVDICLQGGARRLDATPTIGAPVKRLGLPRAAIEVVPSRDHLMPQPATHYGSLRVGSFSSKPRPVRYAHRPNNHTASPANNTQRPVALPVATAAGDATQPYRVSSQRMQSMVADGRAILGAVPNYGDDLHNDEPRKLRDRPVSLPRSCVRD
jgi:hypothetical protein